MITHQDYIRNKIQALKLYRLDCESLGLRPLACVAGMVAAVIRRYRLEHKFYDCV